MMLLRFVLIACCLFGSRNALSGEVYSSFEHVTVSPEKTYVFYSHGYIVEGDDPRPVHPRWGEYDFPAVSHALAKQGFDVIAYHRPGNIDFKSYAKVLAKQVETLLTQGVPANRVNLLGFSRGGRITAHASHHLKLTPVNTIIMAGCAAWVTRDEPWVQVHGALLSMVEVSDTVGTCQLLKNRSSGVTAYDEININTGKEHGAFYLPLEEWLLPVSSWIKERANAPLVAD